MLRRALTDADHHGPDERRTPDGRRPSVPGARAVAGAASAVEAWAVRLHRHLFGRPPLSRAAHVHALTTLGDAFFTVSLAGSLFFNVSFDAARPRILLYLVLTMAPFILVAPLLGPAVDRLAGGPRLVIAATAVGRGVLCLLMAAKLAELLVFPLAFGALVLGKTYSVARNALAPRLVAEDRLVAANSLLARLAAIAGGVGGVVAASVLATSGARTVLVIGTVAFAAAALVSLDLPRPAPAATARPDVAWRELHGPSVVLGAGAVTGLRAAVGFTIFLLGIALKRSAEPAWYFGLVIVALGLGSFAGNVAAPWLRRHFHEDRIVGIGLVVPLALSLVAAVGPNRVGVLLGALGAGAGGAVGRQAFDAVVQRETHELDRGRAFARFDTRFQLAWVLGALLPVILRPPLRVGFLMLALGLVVALVLYLSALRSLHPERGGEEEGHSPPDELLRSARRLLDSGDERAAVVLATSAVLDPPRRAMGRGDPRYVALVNYRRRALGDGATLNPAEAQGAIELAERLRGRPAPDEPGNGEPPSAERAS